MVSNCTCASAARASGETPSPVACRKRSSGEAVGQPIGGRRHELRLIGAWPTDPDRCAPELARRLATASPSQQQRMHFAQQPERQGKSLAHPLQAVLERSDVVRAFANVDHETPSAWSSSNSSRSDRED